MGQHRRSWWLFDPRVHAPSLFLIFCVLCMNRTSVDTFSYADNQTFRVCIEHGSRVLFAALRKKIAQKQLGQGFLSFIPIIPFFLMTDTELWSPASSISPSEQTRHTPKHFWGCSFWWLPKGHFVHSWNFWKADVSELKVSLAFILIWAELLLPPMGRMQDSKHVNIYSQAGKSKTRKDYITL